MYVGANMNMKWTIYIDTLSYTTCPEQYKRYVECPECGAKTFLGNTYKHSQTIKI